MVTNFDVTLWWGGLVLLVWWVYALLSSVGAFSVISNPIPGVPIMPVDFLAGSKGISPFWILLTKWFRLPMRLVGFPYCFGLSVTDSTLIGGEILLEAQHQFGDVFQYAAFGQNVLQVCDAALAKRLLKSCDKVTRPPEGQSKVPLLTWVFKSLKKTNSLLTMESGSSHLKKRSLFKTAFHETFVETLTESMTSVVTKFFEKLDDKFNIEGVETLDIEFGTFTSTMTLEVLMSTTFQCDMTISHDLARDFSTLTSNTWIRMVPFLAFMLLLLPPMLIPLKFLRNVQTSRLKVYKVLDKVLTNILSMREDKVLDKSFCFALRTYSKWPGVSRGDVLDEMLLFLIAGHETTSHSISWWAFELALFPHIQSQCRQAVISGSSSPSAPVTGTGLKLPDIVEFSLLESMRRHPVVPGSTRLITREPVLINLRSRESHAVNGEEQKNVAMPKTKKIVVPVGTFVNLNFFSLQRSDVVWGMTAHEYVPRRWSEFTCEDLTNGEIEGFLPFSYGPRSCLGRQFALAEIRVIMKKMLTRYKWQFSHFNYPREFDSENLMQESLTIRPKMNLPLQFCRL